MSPGSLYLYTRSLPRTQEEGLGMARDRGQWLRFFLADQDNRGALRWRRELGFFFSHWVVTHGCVCWLIASLGEVWKLHSNFVDKRMNFKSLFCKKKKIVLEASSTLFH